MSERCDWWYGGNPSVQCYEKQGHDGPHQYGPTVEDKDPGRPLEAYREEKGS